MLCCHPARALGSKLARICRHVCSLQHTFQAQSHSKQPATDQSRKSVRGAQPWDNCKASSLRSNSRRSFWGSWALAHVYCKQPCSKLF